MKKIEIITRTENLETVKRVLAKNEYSGMTVTSVMGCGNQVSENKDFEKLIKQYDRPVSFFYCDPPYFATESYYKDVGFTAKDHIRLRDTLLEIKGKFLVSYNDCPEIRELWDKPGIKIEEISRLNNLAQRYDGGCQYAELLISNYDTSERARSVRQLSLFDNETILEV